MISNVNIMIALTAIALVVITTILCFHIPRRAHFALKAAVLALFLACYAFFAPLTEIGIFVHLPIMAAIFLYVGLCYQLSLAETLFIGITGYTIEHISSLVESLVTLTDPERFAHFGYNVVTNCWAYALIAASYVFTYALAYVLIVRRLRGLSLLKNATVPIIALSGVMLVVNQILGLTFELYGAEKAGPLLSFLEYVWNLICCVFCLCIQFGIFRMSQTEHELEVAQRLIAQKEQQYHMSKEIMDAIRRKSHNLKYELSALSAGQGQQKYIDEAVALVDSFDTDIHTGNETLDIIFTEKNLYCRQFQITFVCMIDGSKLDFMEPTDQYVLFGNLIDNAINAVQKLENPDRRSIYLNIHTHKQLLLVRMENPFDGELRFRNGVPLTTSGDEENHGFGMTSIRLIAEKYGGNISTRAENNVFYANILFPLP